MQNSSIKMEAEIDSVTDWRTLAGFSEFFNYWQSLRHGGGLPHAEDFDLLALTPWLAEVTLYDIKGPEDIVCRFVGTAIVERMGRDLSQQNTLPQHADNTRDRVLKTYLAITNLPCGTVARFSNHYSSGQSGVIRSLYLPLTVSATGANSRMVCISSREDRRTYAAPIEQTISATDITSLEWIDLGFGIPGDDI